MEGSVIGMIFSVARTRSGLLLQMYYYNPNANKLFVHAEREKTLVLRFGP